MNKVLDSSLMVFMQRQDPRTSKETELKASSVLAKVGLNEEGRELDLMLTNSSSSWLFFSRTREKHKNNSLDLETRASLFHT